MNSETRLMTYLLVAASVLIALLAAGGTAEAVNSQEGEAEFKEFCSACHADGGNIINPKKTLAKADREKNGIKTVKDIITIMRNPGEGMIKFDEQTLPENDAQKIAEYIIKSIK
jgi:cytochrome c6